MDEWKIDFHAQPADLPGSASKRRFYRRVEPDRFRPIDIAVDTSSLL